MKRIATWVIALAAVLGLGLWIHRQTAERAKEDQARSGGGRGDRVVPVRTAPVQVGDVPIYLEGLGSAVGSSTVVVRSQVEGRLDKVAFTEGQAVKKGELLAQIDPRPFENQLHLAQAALVKDQAQLGNAKLNLARDQDLLGKKLISQQQLDDQAAMVAQLDAATQADCAQIDAAKLNLDYARITSPIDGITGVRQVDPGNLVHVNDANGIVVVTALDPIAVLFTLPQDELPQVSDAMSQGKLEVDLFSRDGATELGRGTLQLIDNQINAATATMRLKALAENPQHRLWPNQFLKVRLKLRVEQGAHSIPAVAVQNGPDGQFVYVVQPDSTVKPQPVKVALLQGETALLASGPPPGAQVVIEGQNQLRPGAKVSAHGAGEGAPEGGARQGGRDGAAREGAGEASTPPRPGGPRRGRNAEAP